MIIKETKYHVLEETDKEITLTFNGHLVCGYVKDTKEFYQEDEMLTMFLDEEELENLEREEVVTLMLNELYESLRLQESLE